MPSGDSQQNKPAQTNLLLVRFPQLTVAQNTNNHHQQEHQGQVWWNSLKIGARNWFLGWDGEPSIPLQSPRYGHARGRHGGLKRRPKDHNLRMDHAFSIR